MIRFGLAGTLALLTAACAQPLGGAGRVTSEQKALDLGASSSGVHAAALHDSLLTLDAHLDTPTLFHRDYYDFSISGSVADDGTNVDLPRLKEGGLDGGFWVIYTGQGPLDEASYIAARTSAVLRQMSIREMAAKYADSVELAFAADDAERIHKAGKVVVFQSMENAYPLGEDISLLEAFYVGGLRMLGPVHFSNNQFADSSTDDEVLYEGLSPLGEELVREANRLGIIVDASHASDDALRDMMAVSTTPIILSHSGPDGVFEHARNVPDELLLEVAASGGVIHVNAFGGYLEKLQADPDRTAALEALNAEYGDNIASLSSEQFRAYRAARNELDRQFPPARSTFNKYVEHLLYVLDLVGTDHVGIGADWDGGGGVDGMADVTAVPKITHALVEAGYSKEDIAKIWSGNLLRLMREVETAKTATLGSPDVLK
jgi:membrane dipeptidase